MKLLAFFCLVIALHVGRSDGVALPSTDVENTSTPTMTPGVESIDNSSSVLVSTTESLVPETVSSSISPPEIIQPSSTTTTRAEITNESPVTDTNSSTTDLGEVKKNFIDKLSTQIGDILKHFRSPEPVGFPGQTILEDPLSIPNTTTNLGSVFTGDLYNNTVHGLSNFTIEGVNTVLDQLEVYIMIKMKKIEIIGNCAVDTFIGIKSRGPFNITLINVTAEGTVFLTVNSENRLVANRTVSYMTYDKLSVTTTSGSMMQAALSGAGTAILETLKPYILSQIDERITTEANKMLKDSPKVPFTAEVSPVDLAIYEGRKFVSQYYEPFEIKKIFDHNSDFLTVSVGPVQIRGLSNFFRVGKVNLKMVNGTVQIGIRIITSKLLGRCHFFYDFGKVNAERNGTADFTIQHLQFEAKINQSVDIRKQPILDDLQLETGKIAVHLDGHGKLDYLLELSLQFLPQMLRHVIIDALEEPIKRKIQSEVLDKLNVDQLIQDNLPLLQSLLFSSI